jgi:hypothetical protein
VRLDAFRSPGVSGCRFFELVFISITLFVWFLVEAQKPFLFLQPRFPVGILGVAAPDGNQAARPFHNAAKAPVRRRSPYALLRRVSSFPASLGVQDEWSPVHFCACGLISDGAGLEVFVFIHILPSLAKRRSFNRVNDR